jgi:hypothetical protein
MKQTTCVSIAAALLLASGSTFAAPAKKAAAPPPPIATYWMDASTQSGLGAGMMGGAGARPGLGDIMSMMNGGGSAFSHTLSLRLASRTKPTGAPEADHFIPAGLRMGPSLPLVTPAPTPAGKPEKYEPGSYQPPKGRMLIYWGCGDHVAAGQPMVFDFAQMASGKVPADIQKMAAMAGSMHSTSHSGPTSAPGFGEWPNPRDSRAVPAGGSLLGAHQVKATYAPEMDFTLGAGLDFMPPLGLMDAGAAPSGADLLRWNLAPTATGYALAMFGAGENGDMVMWSSSKSAAFANLDYLSPSDVAREIKAGNVLAPNVSQCLLPAEVAQAVPTGMVMGIGYGPEGYFSDSPKAPTWTAKVRFKTNGSVMRGMGAMMGAAASQPDRGQQAQPQQQPPQRQKRGFGLGGLIGSIPH